MKSRKFRILSARPATPEEAQASEDAELEALLKRDRRRARWKKFLTVFNTVARIYIVVWAVFSLFCWAFVDQDRFFQSAVLSWLILVVNIVTDSRPKP